MSMRRFSTTVRRPRAARALVAAASLALLAPALAACDSGSVADTDVDSVLAPTR